MQSRLGAILWLLLPLPPASAKLPHIVFVVSDDLGWYDCEWTGSGIRTPALAALRRDGLALDNYYVQKVCTPTRAALMTGRYPHRMGMQSAFWPSTPYGLALNETTLAEALSARGYRSHAVGKWHLGMCAWPYTPTFRGFDSFYGFYGGGQDYYTHMNGQSAARWGYDLRLDRRPRCGHGCSELLWNASGRYTAHLFSERAVEVVRAHDPDTPLFLYLAYQNVHEPLQVPDRYAAEYAAVFPGAARATFAGMVAVMDEGVRNVTEALKARGMWADTVFVFTTDNGGPVRPGRVDSVGSSNWPLRGGKHSAYEGGVRGNAFVRGPGIPRDRQYPGLMHAVDWFATLLEAARADAAAGASRLPLDSVSVWRHWVAPGTARLASPRTSVVLDVQRDGMGTVREGAFKLLVGRQEFGGWSAANGSAVAQRPDAYRGQALQLYNVALDAREEQEVSALHPLQVRRLLRFWRREARGARFPESLGPEGEPAPVDGRAVRAWLPWL